ncbi:MAG: hypothetical protein WCS90_01090 [Bacilli bacterium]
MPAMGIVNTSAKKLAISESVTFGHLAIKQGLLDACFEHAWKSIASSFGIPRSLLAHRKNKTVPIDARYPIENHFKSQALNFTA